MYGRIPYLNIDWNSWVIHYSFLSPPLLLTSSVVRPYSDPITVELSQEADMLSDNNHIADTCTYCHVFLNCIQSKRKPVQGLCQNSKREVALGGLASMTSCAYLYTCSYLRGGVRGPLTHDSGARCLPT